MTLGYALFLLGVGFIAGLACWGWATLIERIHDR